MSKTEKKYEECVEILHSLNDVISLVCQLTNVHNRTAMSIVREALDSMEEYENASPEVKAEIEAETDKLYEMLQQDVGVEVEKLDNRKKKSKKDLLN
jgi:hypothetical protein